MGSKWQATLAVIVLVAGLAAYRGTLAAGNAGAQTEPASFKDVSFNVLPEYDDLQNLGYPTVLVVLNGDIEGATAPTTVRFLVPEDAVMNVTGSGPLDNYIDGTPDRKASGIAGWDEVSYELKSQSFMVEYYVPVPAATNRSFSVEYIPLYPVNRLVAYVQEPRKVSDFNVEAQTRSETQERSTDDEGFNFRAYTYGALEAQQKVGFSISYTKKGTAPSVAITDGTSNLVPLVGGVVVGGLLLAGVVYLLRRNPSPAKAPAARTGGSSPQARRTGGARFCTECGATLEGAPRYCDQCGAKQRE